MQNADDRKRTLRTLVELAQGHNPTDCWDDRRARELLRSQSSAAELREIGVGEDLVVDIFPEADER